MKDRIYEAIQSVDLIDKKNKRLSELSGGQQQRVLIAKALVPNSKLLILDEPTSGIHPDTQNKFYGLIHENTDRKITIFLTTHDLYAISRIANKIEFIIAS